MAIASGVVQGPLSMRSRYQLTNKMENGMRQITEAELQEFLEMFCESHDLDVDDFDVDDFDDFDVDVELELERTKSRRCKWPTPKGWDKV